MNISPGNFAIVSFCHGLLISDCCTSEVFIKTEGRIIVIERETDLITPLCKACWWVPLFFRVNTKVITSAWKTQHHPACCYSLSTFASCLFLFAPSGWDTLGSWPFFERTFFFSISALLPRVLAPPLDMLMVPLNYFLLKDACSDHNIWNSFPESFYFSSLALRFFLPKHFHMIFLFYLHFVFPSLECMVQLQQGCCGTQPHRVMPLSVGKCPWDLCSAHPEQQHAVTLH